MTRCSPRAARFIRTGCRSSNTWMNWARPKIARRWDFALRLLHENGVSYNVYGDPHGIDRPWVLDAVPFMISAREWSGLERSLSQRGRLLNLILADIYGPQKLLKDGVLPPELIYGHPGFFASVPRRRASGQWLPASLFSGHRALTGWLVVGDQRPHAGAIRSGVTRWKTGSFSHASCQKFSKNARSSGWRCFSAACAKHCEHWRRSTAIIRASCCSRPDPITKRILNTPISRAI